MYYLRTKPATNAVQFTVDKRSARQSAQGNAIAASTTTGAAAAAAARSKDNLHDIQEDQRRRLEVRHCFVKCLRIRNIYILQEEMIGCALNDDDPTACMMCSG